MGRYSRRVRNVHTIVFIAGGLTLLVTGAFGWLGWRLFSQEEALERQRSRDRFEDAADRRLTGVVRILVEGQDKLARIGPELATTGIQEFPDAVLVLLTRDGVQTLPQDSLLYYPAVPASEPLDQRFEQIEKLEFQSGNLH